MLLKRTGIGVVLLGLVLAGGCRAPVATGGPTSRPAVTPRPSATEAVADWTPARRVAVSGAEAEALRVLPGDRANFGPITYEEDGRRFVVALRGLLPYESAAGVGGPGNDSVILGPGVVAATQPLACSPADGVVPFYEAALQAADRQREQIAIFRDNCR